MYAVVYSTAADKALQKMNKHTARLIILWIEKHLINCENPRALGSALTTPLTGKWRYRIGDYRIIADIDDKNKIVLILDIGHRSNIYK